MVRRNINVLAISDICNDNGYIRCSYNLKLAVRNHHAPTVDNFLLPREIINSFAFNHFSEYEKDFILTCNACNDTVSFTKENSSLEIAKISTGRELSIMVFDKNNNKSYCFTIGNISNFTGLCRRYKSHEEVEDLIYRVFTKAKNDSN